MKATIGSLCTNDDASSKTKDTPKVHVLFIDPGGGVCDFSFGRSDQQEIFVLDHQDCEKHLEVELLTYRSTCTGACRVTWMYLSQFRPLPVYASFRGRLDSCGQATGGS